MNAPTNNTSHNTQTDAGVPPAPPEAHQQAVAAELIEGQGDEGEGRADSGMRGTYSPDDNRLRLYSVSRLDAATFERVKAAGFKWAPKQGLFVAPMWTPDRADLLLELCGDIDDEDTSLVERAEERADRFEGYSDRRGSDADAARRSVRAIADHVPFGQPILVGHHSERRARRDAQRIQDGMRRAVKLWETSTYWQERAKGAVRAAKYKERVDVGHRRIKTIEADKRKQQRTTDAAELFLKLWQREDLTRDQAMTIADRDHVSRCFPLAEFPRALPASQYEGSMSLWSALNGGVIDADTARVIAIGHYTRAIAQARRWIEHYDFRLAYERAMLGEQGGLPAERFELEVGGQVLAGGEWCTVLRITRKADAVVSVRTNRRYVPVIGVEEIRDYRAPSAEAAAAAKAATKLAPLCNFPGEGFIEMTADEWKRKHADYKSTRLAKATAEHGAYRYRSAMVSGGGYRLAQVFITDAKRVDPPPPPPAADAPPTVPPVERQVVARPLGQAKQPNEFTAMRDQLRNGGVQVVAAPQLFATPADLALRMVELAGIRNGSRVLEPSAGTGAIMRALREAPGGRAVRTAVEINGRLVDALRLREEGAEVLHADFLSCSVEQLGLFDAVLMNPPFANAADIQHIEHAVGFLKPGGTLVAICAAGPRQHERLQPLVERHGGIWEPLPAGTFSGVGTNVNTVLLSFDV